MAGGGWRVADCGLRIGMILSSVADGKLAL
jgi:hypothetical protein